MRRPPRRVASVRQRLAQLGQTEIENLDAPIVRDEDVLGLDVPVDDPFLVRRGEPRRDGDRRIRRLCVVTSAPCPEHVAQRLAMQDFADDVRRALVRADVVDREDVGVIQRRRGARFLLEATQAVGVGRVGGRKNLDGDVAPEPLVARA